MIAEEIEVWAATPNVSVSLQIESFQGGKRERESAALAHFTRFLSPTLEEPKRTDESEAGSCVRSHAALFIW